MQAYRFLKNCLSILTLNGFNAMVSISHGNFVKHNWLAPIAIIEFNVQLIALYGDNDNLQEYK